MLSPTLYTCDLCLRPFGLADVTERYLGWLNDDVVNQFSRRYGSHTSREEAEAYLGSLAANEAILAIDHPAHGHVGNIKYGPVDTSGERCDISILIGEKAVWGKGVGRAAVYGVSGYLFNDLKLNRVDAGSMNPAFIRAVQSIGWQIEGVLRQGVKINGHFHDWTLMAQLREEYDPTLEVHIK